MRRESLSKSYISNLLNTVSGFLIPLITVPYVTRRLGVEAFGIYNYALSIVGYFLIFLMFGIPIYGTRSIAKHKSDRVKVSRTFIILQSILLVNLIIISISYYVFIISVNHNIDNRLLYIFYIQIFATAINIDWLFKGLQQYAVITKISTVSRLIGMGLVFAYVKSKTDLLDYALIMSVVMLLQNLSYFFIARKYICFSTIKIRELTTFIIVNLKEILYLFAANISTKIYLSLDVVMIGIMTNNYEVGYYSATNKIVRILIALLTATGPVMMTKISNEYVNIDKTMNLWKKSISFNYLLAIPVTIGGFLIADDLIIVFLGNEYVKAISTFKILIILPVLISSTYFITSQILIPLGMDKLFFHATLVTSLINVFLNFALIPEMGRNGAAIATILSEIFLLLICLKNLPKSIKEVFEFKVLKDYFIASAAFAIFITINNIVNDSIMWRVVTNVTISTVIYFSVLLVVKNDLILIFYNRFRGKGVKK